KQFAEPFQFLAQHWFYSFNSRISRPDSGTTGENQPVDCGEVFRGCLPDPFRAVRQYLVVGYDVTRILQHVLDKAPTFIVVRSARITRGEHGDFQMSICAVAMMFMSCH